MHITDEPLEVIPLNDTPVFSILVTEDNQVRSGIVKEAVESLN